MQLLHRLLNRFCPDDEKLCHQLPVSASFYFSFWRNSNSRFGEFLLLFLAHLLHGGARFNCSVESWNLYTVVPGSAKQKAESSKLKGKAQGKAKAPRSGCFFIFQMSLVVFLYFLKKQSNKKDNWRRNWKRLCFQLIRLRLQLHRRLPCGHLRELRSFDLAQ